MIDEEPFETPIDDELIQEGEMGQVGQEKTELQELDSEIVEPFFEPSGLENILPALIETGTEIESSAIASSTTLFSFILPFYCFFEHLY